MLEENVSFPGLTRMLFSSGSAGRRRIQHLVARRNYYGCIA